MKYRILSVFLSILFIVTLSYAEWIPALHENPPLANKVEIEKKIIAMDNSGCTVEISIPGIFSVETDAGPFIGFSRECPDNSGPVISGYIQIPDYGDVDIQVLDLDFKSYPFSNQFQCSMPSASSARSLEFAAGTVTIGEPGILRDIRIIPVSIMPCKYDTQNSTLNLTSKIVIEFTYNANASENTKQTSRPISSAYKDIYRHLIWNYTDDNTDDFIPSNYLILTPDAFVTSISTLAEWKNQKGVRTTIVPFSEINVTNQDPDILRSYIEYAYYNWANPPDYVLIIGDENVAPIQKFYTTDPPTPFSYYSLPGYYTDDNFFACLEGDDYYPDVVLGRFLAGNNTTVMLLSNKVISYEKTPNTASMDWYDKGIVCADQTEATQRTTKLFVRDIMFDDGGFAAIDTLFEGGQSSLLASWINQGRSFLNYRGSGWATGWAGVDFYTYDVSGLTNLFKLPVVTGIGCGVAKFDEPYTCFGEAWMAAGSVNTHTGAVAFIGPTYNTHTQFNNYLDRGIYEALFEDSLRIIGSALVAGKMSVEEHYTPWIPTNESVEEIVKVLFGQYVVISDPELSTRASAPRSIEVTHLDSVQLGEGIITVSVADETGAPLSGLQTCAYIPDETFSVDLTGETGTVNLAVNPQSLPSNLTITVTGLDIDSYSIAIPVFADGQFVSHLESSFIENPPGDTLLAPGETIILSDHAKNYGNIDAEGVWGIISTTGAGVTIIADSVFYGNIASGADTWGESDFCFEIPQDYTGQILPFIITYHDAEQHSWNSEFTLEVHRPNIILKNTVIDPGPDGILERGGEAEIEIVVQNIGDLPAYDIMGTLTSNDQEIIIIEGESDFYTFSAGETKSNTNSPFVFRVSETCPIGHPALFNIELSGDQGGFYYSVQFELEIVVGDPSAIDPAVDEQGLYYAYESRDILYVQAPVYQWVEISPAEGGPGTEIEIDPVTQVYLLDLPFDFVYYGQSFDRITVTADGFIVPDSLEISSPPGFSIPFHDYIDGMIAPLWYDMYCPVYEPGDISWHYDEVSGAFRIEYHEWSHNNSNIIDETFQIVLYNPEIVETPTGDSEIEFIYEDIEQAAFNNSLCGIETPDQEDGIEMWDEMEYPNTSFPPESFTAIRFTTAPPVIVGVDDRTTTRDNIPSSVFLAQNYPNPFNNSTIIEFGLPAQSQVRLEIFNVLGQRVALIADDIYPSGTVKSIWDGRSSSGSELASGIYICRLQTTSIMDGGDNFLMRKMLFVK